MNITQTIVRLAAPYTAVAFDVFDTLLKRDVAKPTDLFLLLGEEFAHRRVQAEAEARAAAHGEVSLAEIYATSQLSGYDPARNVHWNWPRLYRIIRCGGPCKFYAVRENEFTLFRICIFLRSRLRQCFLSADMRRSTGDLSLARMVYKSEVALCFGASCTKRV